MTIHFTEQEFGQRQGAVQRSLVAEAFLDKTGLTMSLGETSIVTSTGPERVNHAPMELVVN